MANYHIIGSATPPVLKVGYLTPVVSDGVECFEYGAYDCYHWNMELFNNTVNVGAMIGTSPIPFPDGLDLKYMRDDEFPFDRGLTWLYVSDKVENIVKSDEYCKDIIDGSHIAKHNGYIFYLVNDEERRIISKYISDSYLTHLNDYRAEHFKGVKKLDCNILAPIIDKEHRDYLMQGYRSLLAITSKDEYINNMKRLIAFDGDDDWEDWCFDGLYSWCSDHCKLFRMPPQYNDEYWKEQHKWQLLGLIGKSTYSIM